MTPHRILQVCAVWLVMWGLLIYGIQTLYLYF